MRVPVRDDTVRMNTLNTLPQALREAETGGLDVRQQRELAETLIRSAERIRGERRQVSDRVDATLTMDMGKMIGRLEEYNEGKLDARAALELAQAMENTGRGILEQLNLVIQQQRGRIMNVVSPEDAPPAPLPEPVSGTPEKPEAAPAEPTSREPEVPEVPEAQPEGKPAEAPSPLRRAA